MSKGKETERRLIARAQEVVGVDPDTDALSENTLPIRTIHAGAEAVPEPDRSFDLISANMVFEHVSDPVSVLRESARLLKPGGRVVIHTPNVWYPVTLAAACVPTPIRTRLTAWLEKRSPKDIYPTRYRMNRTRAVHQTAEQAGLEVVSIQRTADSPELIALGPLVAFELGLIALTRTRLGKAMASNLIITLAKPHAVECERELASVTNQAQTTLMREAA
jgi:SAM-dependent methyltransferase